MKQVPILIQLIHIHGPFKGEIKNFSGSEITVGRHPSCDLQFPKDLVAISRYHAKIIRDGNRFKIIDQSTNGTFVNNERIKEAYLKNGDVIFFTQGGPKVSFLTQMGDAAQAAGAVQPPPTPQQTTSQYDKQPVAKPPQASVPPIQAPARVPPPTVQRNSTPAPPVQTTGPPSPPAQDEGIRIETIKAPLVIQYGATLQSFNELPIVVGTRVSCDMVLDHPALVAEHAKFFFYNGDYMVKDLTGQNMIRVNEQLIASPSPVRPRDIILLTPQGPSFQFMEGGRMIEVHMPEGPEEQASAVSQTTSEPSKKKKKSGSLFGNLFR